MPIISNSHIEPIRLDHLLTSLLTEYSRSEIQRLIQAGNVKIDGKIINSPGHIAKHGVAIDFLSPPDAENQMPTPFIAILYEDEDIAVLNKPAGVIIHPTANQRSGTLLDFIKKKYPEINSIGETKRPGIVHRLDQDTTGVLAVARTAEAQFDLKQQWKERETQKTYLTIVQDVPENLSAEIDAPIGVSLTDPRKRIVTDESNPDRRSAFTSYNTLEVFGSQAALLEVSILTGRTHQIRVHLAAIGHPVLGDKLYGTNSEFIDRQALHAAQLGFRLPSTHQYQIINAPLPEDMTHCITQLRNSFGSTHMSKGNIDASW
ncbi:MAG: RluA family pseudouridine synthase [Dehalococcoidia bacterium]|jgi:23S rRNA pseudouridine1911/1915/1917 synthase|nr:RluA family pseudouridine synthase [Dehalococcoidia bacterium]